MLHDHGAPGHAHLPAPPRDGRPLRIGIGGPVGSGKTALVANLCRLLADTIPMVVVTNDIFTKEDAEALRRMQVLADDRIVPVETGCCPHTAIRDDISANLDAIEQLEHAVQIQPKHFGSAKNLAILYQQAGFRNKALEAWERAMRLAPDEATRKSIKEHIVSLL